ncbi:MAG: hypothetical protein SF123_25125 [Chloroflexota bacterium]|nr:hypothetical protein [Chloroflexota bacterium]
MKMVTFYSHRFDTTPLPDAINDVLGHDLAAWLLAGLRARGYDADDVIGEDYGYGFWLRLDQSPVWISATQYEPPGYEGQAESRWLVHISADAGCLWLYRKRPKQATPERLRQLAQDVHTLLLADPSISGIEWWTQDVRIGTPTAAP